ncbi:MAG: c-type cytochrome biogenesis protein CcmI [Burkholderiales bacterium]|nr:c-type cytochrome biogenesis protein CcmI [Burkholderiales bacterium]
MNPAIAFIVIAAILTALVVWTLLRPLLKRRALDSNSTINTNVQALRIELAEARRDHAMGLLSDASLPEAERELEARVLHEAEGEAVVQTPRYKGTAIALGVLLPIFAIVGYAAVGSPAGVIVDSSHPALPAQATATATGGTANAASADEQMDQLFRMAEERLNKEPNDAKGWLLLARAKSSVGRFADALKAYEKAAALLPNEADVWADYADAAAGLSQGDMKGKPLDLINKSLALDPKNPKALLLRGTYEIQSGELAAAEKTFTLAKSVSEPNSGFTQIADNALQDIRSRTSGTGAAAPAAPAAPTNAAASNAGAPLATLALTLSPEARKAAEANTAAAVFLIVRAAGAERGPPLAAKKLTAGELDKPVTLTANDGMIGGAGLKPGADVTIQARLSLAGQPMAAAGDWQSARINAKLPATELKLAISESVKP